MVGRQELGEGSREPPVSPSRGWITEAVARTPTQHSGRESHPGAVSQDKQNHMTPSLGAVTPAEVGGTLKPKELARERRQEGRGLRTSDVPFLSRSPGQRTWEVRSKDSWAHPPSKMPSCLRFTCNPSDNVCTCD